MRSSPTRTDMIMSDATQRLVEIRARRDAATPGPWTLSQPDGSWISPHVCNTYGFRRDDAEFIAASWADVGWLLEHIEQLQRELDASKRAYSLCHEHHAERDELRAQRQAVLDVCDEQVRLAERRVNAGSPSGYNDAYVQGGLSVAIHIRSRVRTALEAGDD